jgi:hypothetical protein
MYESGAALSGLAAGRGFYVVYWGSEAEAITRNAPRRLNLPAARSRIVRITNRPIDTAKAIAFAVAAIGYRSRWTVEEFCGQEIENPPNGASPFARLQKNR